MPHTETDRLTVAAIAALLAEPHLAPGPLARAVAEQCPQADAEAIYTHLTALREARLLEPRWAHAGHAAAGREIVVYILSIRKATALIRDRLELAVSDSILDALEAAWRLPPLDAAADGPDALAALAARRAALHGASIA